MITCRQFVEVIMAYMDDELDPGARAAFEEHFRDHCPECDTYLETYREAIRLGKMCSDDEVPPEVPEKLVQAVLAARRKEQG